MAGLAHAQLEVGGQPFESNDTSSSPASADNLELQVWVGLNELDGYDPGSFGAETDELSVAIATFQIRNSMEVTGQASEELAKAIQAQVRTKGGTASAAAAANQAGGEDPCLRREAVETASKTRRFARLARAGERLFNRAGGDSDVARDVSQIANETTAIASDVAVLSPDCQQ
jgi:hypothetical protein